MRVCQWNLNGLKARKDELQMLLNQSDFEIACVQESHLKPADNPRINGYTVIRKDYTGGQIACGGVCILIRNDIPFVDVSLSCDLQAVAARVLLQPSAITICSIYLPPRREITVAQLQDLYRQLPAPVLLLGDYNAHHQMWGSDRTDARGALIERFTNHCNLNILNNSTSTYLCPRSGKLSNIDLSISCPSLQTGLTWRTITDAYGSDHFPICIESLNRCVEYGGHSKWQVKRANWPLYQQIAQLTGIDLQQDIDSLIKELNERILQAAESAIPRSPPRSFKSPPVPWWSDECKNSVKKRKQALRKFLRRPTIQNHQQYKAAKTHARYIIKKHKRESWQTFLSNLSCNAPVSVFWDTIRRIKGYGQPQIITFIEENNVHITDQKQIANKIGKHFYTVSATSNYPSHFQLIKNQIELTPLTSATDPQCPLNKPFSDTEFQLALRSRKNTSPGPDLVCITMIKNLSPANQTVILQILNKVFITGKLPKIWKTAVTIPIIKKDKSPKLVSSYRPISLTCTMCKLLERLVATRMQWHLEVNGHLPPWQSGFRKGRSTRDNLVYLESVVSNALGKKEKVLAVFLDLESAFDRVWRLLILKALKHCGIEGNIYNFVKNFLENRTFKVRCGNTLSDSFDQENGVPQGCVLSPLLFCISMNKIFEQLSLPVRILLYADDIVLFMPGKDLLYLQEQLQAALDKVITWLQSNGFKISPTKSVAVLFCNRRTEATINLYVNNTPIVISETVKYLGLTFDTTLSWVSHLKQLKSSCLGALNLLRTVSNTCWGADRVSMLKLFKCLIRSRIDYGCAAYGSAKGSVLRMMNPVYNSGLRIAIGAFRSSPIPSIYVDAGEPPLHIRRQLLDASFFVKILSNPAHPLLELLPNSEPLSPHSIEMFKRASLFCRMSSFLREESIEIPPLIRTSVLPSPPWLVPKLKVCFKLTKFNKPETPSYIYLNEFLKLKNALPNSDFVYTDGSKSSIGVGASVVCRTQRFMYSLSPISSNYTSELFAVYKGINMTPTANNRLVICTDSLSVLLSLDNIFTDNGLVQDILVSLTNQYTKNVSVAFIWIPGHCNIRGNETADAFAKRATTEGSPYRCVAVEDFVHDLKTKINGKWQQEWHNITDNKLREIRPRINGWKSSIRPTRREEVILTRLRIGHTRLTHGFLMAREAPPICQTCQCPLSVRHLLVECSQYSSIRASLGVPSQLVELLSDTSDCLDQLFLFLQQTQLYTKI